MWGDIATEAVVNSRPDAYKPPPYRAGTSRFSVQRSSKPREPRTMRLLSPAASSARLHVCNWHVSDLPILPTKVGYQG